MCKFAFYYLSIRQMWFPCSQTIAKVCFQQERGNKVQASNHCQSFIYTRMSIMLKTLYKYNEYYCQIFLQQIIQCLNIICSTQNEAVCPTSVMAANVKNAFENLLSHLFHPCICSFFYFCILGSTKQWPSPFWLKQFCMRIKCAIKCNISRGQTYRGRKNRF